MNMNKSKIETKHAKPSWKLKIKRINNYIDTIQKGIRTPNSKKKCEVCVCVFFFTWLVKSTYSFYEVPIHPRGARLKVQTHCQPPTTKGLSI